MPSAHNSQRRSDSPYDLDVFPSERFTKKPQKPKTLSILLGLACSVVFGVAAAGTLWFAVGRTPDPGVPQLPAVKDTPQAQAADPDSKWLTPLLLPLALQSFEGPLPADSAKADAEARRQAAAASAAASRRPGVGPVAPVAATAAAGQPSPALVANPTAPGVANAGPQFAPRPVMNISLPPVAPAPDATPYRAALSEPALASPAPALADVDTPVYDADAADVVPPVPVDAKALPPTTGASGAALNRMELLIGTNGRVEGVRMASRPARMSDMMMLSGAKNWVFKPATKDGKPVRYRLPITWAVSQ